ncbi:exopolysaccharide production repressor protein [Neorhizobium galegae]|uniref:Exopolysaccharide production repressor protein ExoX n=1 Tax=Neorhizobium galegae bv. orientalis str. HAMBI 540 TaxID=1028800 RepID=A0A068STG7_NEOGA|nr:exopolysaccharide production repressor protein [Neorhizobium galegae]CDN49602.1 Exopolysaccharide production repressor protein ExoX [Neorhizobium galegae bv. orientalis str. HAMBI 540]CDZ46814.1 Exopolysaccharide production repressor [Neorhizobium galegae bv. orientalis]
MYAPRVFISMTVTLIVFAVAAYLITGSFYTAVIQTLICAVLIQAGYFAAVLYLVRREKQIREAGATSDAAAATKSSKDGSRRDGLRADAAPNLPASDT